MSHDLSKLTPNAGNLSRDAVLFEAGRASARTPWHWPALTLAFAALSILFGVQLAIQQPVEAPVAAPLPPTVAPAASELPSAPSAAVESHWGAAFQSSAGYLSQRDRVLHFGVETLPATTTTTTTETPPLRRDTIDDLLKSS